MARDDGSVQTPTHVMCQLSHGGPTCTTDAEFHRRHKAYREGLANGLRQYRGN